MVLAAFGVEKTEEELRRLSGCDPDGTTSDGVVKAAQDLGYRNARKCYLNFEELKSVLEQGLHPIVYLRIQALPSLLFDCHAVVVVGVETAKVKLLDPRRGEIEVPEQTFHRQWSLMRGLAILVEP